MLVLAQFRRLLSQILSTSDDEIHTAVLSTPAGGLVSFASLREVSPNKAEIRTMVGMCGEIWSECKGDKESEGVGMAECEVSMCHLIKIIELCVTITSRCYLDRFYSFPAWENLCTADLR